MESKDPVLTHEAVDRRLVGLPVALAEGRASVRLATVSEMAADDRGLVHGGFLFGLADYAAMLAVNEPTVVLAAAESRFLAPVRVGETVTAEAERLAVEGRKHRVKVVVRSSGAEVFAGEFLCIVPARHVLDAEDRGREERS